MIDKIGLHDQMSDYSNEFGDVRLVEAVQEWLNTKMGGDWVIQVRKNMPTIEQREKMARLEAIVELSEMIAEEAKRHGEPVSDILSTIRMQLVARFEEVQGNTTP